MGRLSLAQLVVLLVALVVALAQRLCFTARRGVDLVIGSSFLVSKVIMEPVEQLDRLEQQDRLDQQELVDRQAAQVGQDLLVPQEFRVRLERVAQQEVLVVQEIVDRPVALDQQE